jgi:hypothetical protein
MTKYENVAQKVPETQFNSGGPQFEESNTLALKLKASYKFQCQAKRDYWNF